ncbi:MAG TPA: hypothetical protein PLD48_00680 [Bacillota bacterium]|nr:hypothetical protein [Bacillota bacterium]HOK68865.1 hypothetical protein [Bacillota bacterium]HPP85662.1 hypothetical protein [Bacillota bacterium]
MKKQLRYKDEVRPSLWRFVPFVIKLCIAAFCIMLFIGMSIMGDTAESEDLLDFFS